MKTKLYYALGMLFVAVIAVPSHALMTDLEIIPANPDISSDISIKVTGFEAVGASITKSEFTMSGNSLSLDLYITYGMLQVITDWDFTEEVGTLPVGEYSVCVSLSPDMDPTVPVQRLGTCFEVVPEPMTLSLLALGGLLIRRRK